MAVSRVRPLVLESVYEGGTVDQANAGGVTEVAIGSEYLDAAGYCAQRPAANTATADTKVRLERLATDDMQLTDPNAGTVQLQTLLTSLTGQAGSHNATRDPIHFLADGGPGDGFASGAVCTTTYVSGTPLPATVTWWTSSAQTIPIYSVTYSYPTGSPLPSTITRKLFNAAGAVVRTSVDAPTYAAGTSTETLTTRTWS